MTDRIAQVSSDVAALEKQMMDLRNSNDMVNLRAGSVGQQQLEELATAAARAAIERSQLEATYNRASALAKQGSSDALSTVLNSPTIAQMREQEATASRRAAELSSRYGSGYPGVKSAQADLSAARGQLGAETQRIVSSLGTQLKAAQAHEADVKQQLTEARTLAVQSENARARLDQLQQEVVTRRSLYKTLLERAQQTVNQPVGTQTPDVHVVSTAAPPGGPSGPNMKIAGGLGGAAGGILGCLLALTRLGRIERQIPPGQLADISGLQIAASMPAAFLRRSRGKLGEAVLTEPQGAQARAIRALRDRVRRLGDPTTPSIVMVSSAAQDEDALQIALACGRVAAGDGERVLLIDANLAAPRVARMLGNGSEGLGAFFDRRADWRGLVMEDPSTALDLLASQDPAADPVEQICSTQFQNLLVEASDDFDLVIVVAPAVTSEAARALAQRVDAVLVVVDSHTTKPILQKITAQFEKLARRRVALIELQA
jgi:Mrp family chromosome partitioning ATPase